MIKLSRSSAIFGLLAIAIAMWAECRAVQTQPCQCDHAVAR